MTLPSVLFVVFLVLKLVGVIDWSWWAVSAPLWIGFLVAMAIVVIACMSGGLKGARK